MNRNLPTSGTVFAGRYKVEDVLGDGGFARVFRAYDLNASRYVALKVLSPAPMKSPGLSSADRRFYREARLLSTLRSASTVRLFDYGRTPYGLMYLAFEHIPGVTLGERIAADGPFAEAATRDVLIQLLLSLHEAHEHRILHRDLKPSNVLLYTAAGAEHVKLIDFGVAKSVAIDAVAQSMISIDGMIVGSPAYMSPEQVLGGSLGPASDLYGVGLIGWEMLVGRPTFRPETRLDDRIRTLADVEVPRMSGVSAELRGVVSTLLRREPYDRYRSAEEALAALDHRIDATLVQRPENLPVSSVSAPASMTSVTSTLLEMRTQRSEGLESRSYGDLEIVFPEFPDEVSPRTPRVAAQKRPPAEGARSVHPDTSAKERTLLDGRYQLGAVLGRGGMGVVYRALDVVDDREVAVKVLPPGAQHDAEIFARFQRELDLASQLHHPNIVQQFGRGESDGMLYMAMELLEGMDLAAFLRGRNSCSLAETLDILTPVAAAVAHAHSLEIIHRDLKPSNIFLVGSPDAAAVRVLDFGLAKSLAVKGQTLTATGQLTGTPSYVAPEVVLSEKGEKPCDVYSFALIFLEMLSGERVFAAGSFRDLLMQRLLKDPDVPAPWLGTPVETFVRAAAARNPAKRLADGAALLRELERLRDVV